MDDESDREMEALLARYRPAAPPPQMRERALGTRSARRWTGGLPVAAGLAVAALLQWATARIDARLSRALDGQPDAVLAAEVEAVMSIAPLPRAYLLSRLKPPKPTTWPTVVAEEGL